MFSKASRPDQPHIQFLVGFLLRGGQGGIKRPGSVVHHSSPSSTEVKNQCGCALASFYAFVESVEIFVHRLRKFGTDRI